MDLLGIAVEWQCIIIILVVVRQLRGRWRELLSFVVDDYMGTLSALLNMILYLLQINPPLHESLRVGLLHFIRMP